MYTLIVGNKMYSSWSLRGWLVTKLSGAPFRESPVSLNNLAPDPATRGFSPTGLVPCLVDGDVVVWDSLAIAEYLAERHPGMWPADPVARAFARSMSAEMHSGFGALRSEMTMCVRERVDVRPWSTPLTRNIARIEALWTEARRRFGGRLRMALCGGAALSRDVGEFIDTLGIPVYEGYGMTETSPIITVNSPSNRKLGTAGKVLDGVTLCIDTVATGDPVDGEIVVRGPNVMRGYYNLPDETAKAIGPAGELRTGDMGHVDAEGYLHITGRIAEQYKLENGKYVAPSPLEEKIRSSPLVANVMVFGLNRPHNVALVVPNMEVLKALLNGDGRGKELAELLEDERAKSIVMAEIDAALADCKGYERIKKIALIGEDFTQDNGLLTPTMKIRRKRVVERWSKEIDRLYQ